MRMIMDRIHNGHETIKDPLYVNPFSYGRIEIDSEKCSRCGQCRSLCVVEAITLTEDKTPIINNKKCIYCGKCIKTCPKSAMVMNNDYKMAELPSLEELGEEVGKKIHSTFNRALSLRSVDTGSCNACMLELNGTQNTYYDLSRFGINFAASPRHADGIVITGPVAVNMKEALEKTYYAMAEPRLVIAVGACAHDGGIFKHGHGNYAPLHDILPVDLVIPGCPPSPQAILYGLLKLMDKMVL